jgi:hypothetical protein
MARHGALLRRMLHDYRVRQWKIVIDGKDLSGHLDDELWRNKKENKKSSDEIKITVKPSALIILKPAATIKT